MPLDTNLDVSPFWDSYSPNNDYYQVLFRAGVALQARELNELQSMLQNQVTSFGDNIFVQGTIVKGCAFSFDPNYTYVKILDLQVNGQPVNIGQYANAYLQNSANVMATVVNSIAGLQSQNPNLNTLYIKYIQTGAVNQSAFANGDVLNAYDSVYGIQSLAVANAGTGYSNLDTLIFTSSTGTGAAGKIITNASGAIINAIVLTEGHNYFPLTANVTIANTTGGTANGSGGVITALNTISQLTVANSTFWSGGNTQFNTVGQGYAFKVGDGIIYQKGYFVEVDPQTVIVSPYTNVPDGLSVGFTTNEAIVNNNVDLSLNDNAQGTPNYNAPGAYRLKLTPTLTVVPTANVTNSNTFFNIVEFQGGYPIIQNQSSQYNVLGNTLAERTDEEAGNFVVQPFSVAAADINANTTYLQLRISPGIAYVDGFRFQTYGTYAIPMRKGTDVKQKTNVNISTSFGNFININNLQGIIPFNQAVSIQLQDTAGSTPAAAAGNQIGTAKVRSLLYATGVAQDPATVYSLYLFDIVMNAGTQFANVKSVWYNGGGSPSNGSANVILNGSNQAVLQDTNFDTLLFPFTQKATKTIRDLSNNNDINYTYYTLNTGVSFAANGIFSLSLSGSDTFPFGGNLDSAEMEQFIFIARGSANASVAGAGTASISTGSNVVTGSSSTFLSTFVPFDWVVFGQGDVLQITSIANNTYMTLNGNPSHSNTTTSYALTFPVNEPIAMYGHPSRSMSVSGATVTANLGLALSGVLNISVAYFVERTGAVQLSKQQIYQNVVKIYTGNNVSSNGTFCLGVPDAFNLQSVTATSNSNYVTSSGNVTANFILDSGQKDDYYGLSYLKPNPTNPLNISNNMYITATFSSFGWSTSGGGIGFFDVDSYPVNDASGANLQIYIRTQNIPVYVSPTTGISYDLRDTLDFRPVVTPTANTNNVLANATCNPSASEAFAAGEKYFPAPNELFTCALQYYQGRQDILVLSPQGQFTEVEGIASDLPTPPTPRNGAMTLANIVVPPYPTLSIPDGVAANRPDYTTQLTLHQNRVYTMADIGEIDERLTNVEYYTALNLLEQQASNLVILNTSGLNRFKNGIFVDSFNDYTSCSLADPEFNAALDTTNGWLIPSFTQSTQPLQVANTTNTVIVSNVVTLPSTNSICISQPYATKERSCTNDQWNFRCAVGILFPWYDPYIDYRLNPVNTLITNNTPSSLFSFNTKFNNIFKINQDDANAVFIGNSLDQLATTTTTNTSVISIGGSSIGATTVSKVGDYQTDLSLTPFIKPQLVKFKFTGMKPGATLYGFFDGVDVTNFIQPCVVDVTTTTWTPTGLLGNNIVVDSFGCAAGHFYLPENTFYCGDRGLFFMDHDDFTRQDLCTTSGSVTFHSYNFWPDIFFRPFEIVCTCSSNVISVNPNNLQLPPPLPPTVSPVVPPVVTNIPTPNITPTVAWSNLIANTVGLTLESYSNAVTVTGGTQSVVIGFSYTSANVFNNGTTRAALLNAVYTPPVGNVQTYTIFNTNLVPNPTTIPGTPYLIGQDNQAGPAFIANAGSTVAPFAPQTFAPLIGGRGFTGLAIPVFSISNTYSTGYSSWHAWTNSPGVSGVAANLNANVSIATGNTTFAVANGGTLTFYGLVYALGDSVNSSGVQYGNTSGANNIGTMAFTVNVKNLTANASMGTFTVNLRAVSSGYTGI